MLGAERKLEIVTCEKYFLSQPIVERIHNQGRCLLQFDFGTLLVKTVLPESDTLETDIVCLWNQNHNSTVRAVYKLHKYCPNMEY
jgi:hypothetical protein